MNVSKSVHQSGSGIVKFARTNAILQMTQGDMALPEFINAIARGQESLNADFGQLITTPGHSLEGKHVIDINHLMSMIFLGGVDPNLFAYPINKLLEANPDGRIDDCQALTHSFLRHLNAHKGAPPSATATARALTAKVGGPPAAAAAKSTAAKDTTLGTGCTICANLGFRNPTHSTENCAGKVGGPRYNAAKHAHSVAFAQAGFKRPTKSATANVATTAVTAVATPVAVPTGGVYDTEIFKNASAYAAKCAVGSNEWLDACSAVANIVTPSNNNNA
jgi:hypothetical protein